jgi:hypothetical protein
MLVELQAATTLWYASKGSDPLSGFVLGACAAEQGIIMSWPGVSKAQQSSITCMMLPHGSNVLVQCWVKQTA